MTLSEADIEKLLSAAETIEKSLAILSEKQSLSREQYHADQEIRDIVERRFVKATEAALDIAETIAVNECSTRPESNPAAMQALAEANVVGGDTAEKMVRAARFRNVLAHTYGDVINHDDVYEALHDLERYRDFLFEIRTYLDETDALDS